MFYHENREEDSQSWQFSENLGKWIFYHVLYLKWERPIKFHNPQEISTTKISTHNIVT